MSSKKTKKKVGRPSLMLKGNELDDRMVKIVEKMVSLGFTSKDIGLVLGVDDRSIRRWKNRFPELREAYEKGKELAKANLVAKMFRGATGYDFEEVEERYKVVEKVNSEGKIVRKEIPVSKVVKRKHQPSNSYLAVFMACNLMPELFKKEAHVNVNKQEASLSISGELEADQIKRLAGKLLEIAEKQKRKEIVSKVVGDAGNPEESGHAGEVSEDNPEGAC